MLRQTGNDHAAFTATRAPGKLRRHFQHAHFTGGGMWGLSSTIVADFIHFLINKGISGQEIAIADIYKSFSGVSIGSALAASILLPDQDGKPRYKNFIPIRDMLRTDSASIFDPRRKKGFMPIKMALSAIVQISSGIHNKLECLDRHGDNAIEVALPSSSRFGQWISVRKRAAITEAERILQDTFGFIVDKGTDRIHFDNETLIQCLSDRFRITCADGTQRNALTSDLLKPMIIPSIALDKADNSFHFFVSTGEESLENIPQKFQGQFTATAPLDEAVGLSSLLSPIFRARDNPQTGKTHTDGSNMFTADMGFRGIKRLLGIDPSAYGMTIFDCNPANTKEFVTQREQEEKFALLLTGYIRRAQAFAVQQNSYREMVMDPKCKMMVPLSFAECPHSPYPAQGKLRDTLDEFTAAYTGHVYDDVIRTQIPVFSRLTQAAHDRQTHKLLEYTGILTVARMLPELVQIAKELILHGPLSERLTDAEREDAIHNIDRCVPPADLRGIDYLRQSNGGSPYPDYHNLVHLPATRHKKEAGFTPAS